MAFTIVRDERIGNKRYVEILFEDASVADEALIPGVPLHCTITKMVSAQIAGTAATTDPAIGRRSAFVAGTFDELGANIGGAPATRVGTSVYNQIALYDGNLYMQPRPNAGADNTMRVELHIADGWI